MTKNYYSLGLMSGTSVDGIDASIILSNGENNLEIIDNHYIKYKDSFKSKIEKFIYKINNREDLNNNIDLYSQIKKDITLEHAKISKDIIKKNKKINIDLVGFHGQTILHKPSDGYSIQVGDPNLLSNLLKKDIYFDFRSLDIKNGGEGAPVTPIYHKLLYKKINIDNEIIFLNIGGISNLTYVNQKDSLISFDTGPGNCIIDNWIKHNSLENFDKNGENAFLGKVDKNILLSVLDSDFASSKINKSLDIKDFDISFARGLSLSDGAATITCLTSYLIADKINNFINREIKSKKNCKLILCGGGRKNTYLTNELKKLINVEIINIDQFNIDGDFIESQAFAFLAIRSYFGLPISFPSTTNCKEPSVGGTIIKNFN